MKRHGYLLANLKEWLENRGFQASEQAPKYANLEPDLVLMRDGHLMVVEAKVANEYRSSVFPALIGDLILRAGDVESKAHILIALLVRKMNDKAVADLRHYAQAYLPALNWFLLDESGNGRASIQGEVSELSVSPFSADSYAGKRKHSRGALFSPNNQWLLKMLLMPGIGSRYWGGLKKRPSSIVELARAAQVPQPSVSAFISKFEDREYIRRVEGRPIVIRHRELLDEWFYAMKHSSLDRIPAKQMYGDSARGLVDSLRSRAASSQDGSDMILSHHMACHLHGIARANVEVGWGYSSKPISHIMRDYDLVEDHSSSPSFWLMPVKGDAVQKGSVLADGVPVCDILQCYLDVRESEARGQEQADYILDQVLMPHFEGRV
jgi:hypothetical protein